MLESYSRFISLWIVAVGVVSLCAVVGCEQTTEPPVEPAEPETSNEPELAVRVKFTEMGAAAIMTATTPTGGWKLSVDRGSVEGETANVYVTLYGPGEGETVTQAITEAQATWQYNIRFTKAFMHVRQVRRGDPVAGVEYDTVVESTVAGP